MRHDALIAIKKASAQRMPISPIIAHMANVSFSQF